MYKKSLISVALASTLALSGCFESGSETRNAGSSSTITLQPDYAEFIAQFEGKTWPVFNPQAGSLPVPNDLIFSDVGDGSFAVDIPPSDADNPVLNALNNLSGGSTVAPYDIRFNGTIDENSVKGPEEGLEQNVFLIEVDYGDTPPLIALNQGMAPSGGAPFNDIRVEKIELQGSSGAQTLIRVSPLKPLSPNKRYVVVVTNEVTAGGEPISSSPQYGLISSDLPIIRQLKPVRSLIGLWEGVAQAGLNTGLAELGGATFNQARAANHLPPLTVDNIALSYSFTTSNDKTVLTSIANPQLWLQAQASALGLDIDTSVLEPGSPLSALFPTPRSRSINDDVVTRDAGQVSAALDANFGGAGVQVSYGDFWCMEAG